eukprot:TRINITY_DN43922_c0_g1_i1.p1 TRINITY_DN43922_c0_g1~~TRINITY_DN43922_c0_g1_i1.p1  ORF type:complete len:261 (-),score=48.61 TRINITY_DN43922_c0_g1_i1:177-959(-)
MAGLGPAPRIGAQVPGDGLQFFTPPAGGMQPPAGMGGLGPQAPPAPGNFYPPQGQFQQPQAAGQMGSMGGQQIGSFPPPSSSSSYDDDFENEPPLLEELGINLEHIILRMKGVAFFKKLDEEILSDLDLSGPLCICLTLGVCLLLAGKLQFGYIYGLASGGSFFVCCLINVMSQKGGIDLYRTMSILGYGLIPIVLLAFLGIFLNLKSSYGTFLAAACIAWTTATSSRFFATAVAMQDQRWLVAYPVGLVYTFFALITVF